MKTRDDCHEMVAKHFGWDWKKTLLWFTTNNDLVGGTTPHCFGEWKGYPRLHKLIKGLLDENKRK